MNSVVVSGSRFSLLSSMRIDQDDPPWSGGLESSVRIEHELEGGGEREEKIRVLVSECWKGRVAFRTL